MRIADGQSDEEPPSDASFPKKTRKSNFKILDLSSFSRAREQFLLTRATNLRCIPLFLAPLVLTAQALPGTVHVWRRYYR